MDGAGKLKLCWTKVNTELAEAASPVAATLASALDGDAMKIPCPAPPPSSEVPNTTCPDEFTKIPVNPTPVPKTPLSPGAGSPSLPSLVVVLVVRSVTNTLNGPPHC